MGELRTLTVPGQFDRIQDVCAFVSRGAREAGLNEDAIFHLELCCDEACTNIIEHAYGAEGEGPITVSYESDDTAFRVNLHDKGRSFSPDDVPKPIQISGKDGVDDAAFDELIENLQVGGLGLHFMRNLMDEVLFSFDDSSGNSLILIKFLNAAGEQ